MDVYCQAGLALLCIVLAKFIFTSSPHTRVLDVYTVPGKWYPLKYGIVVVMLLLRKFIAYLSSRKDLKPGYGVQSHDSLEEMDRKQPLSEDSKAVDAVYINGADRIGWHIIAGIARRPHNVDGFLILKVPGVGLLLSPKLPDTMLKSEEEDNSYSSEGLTLTPLEPMRLWHVQYNGNMRLSHNPRKKLNIILDAKWHSDCRIFNYDSDLLIKNIAKAMSREEWNSRYFKNLRGHHQTHYEQFGQLTGRVFINDVDFNINMSVMRDHSFGIRREWKAFHRYLFHIFTLADGRRGTVGIVCIPSMFTRLEIGYVYGTEGLLNAVCDIDFELYQHGESGTPPTDYGFTFWAGKEYYEVKVHVYEWTQLFLGLEWEARIIESLCRYTINGVEGWGVVEWMYAHSGGRPHKTQRQI